MMKSSVGEASDRPQHTATIIVNMLSVSHGAMLGWPSTTLPQLLSEESSPIGRPITMEDASWLGSLICLSACVSTPMFTYVSNRFGRKTCGYLATVPCIVSWLLIIFGRSIATLYIARLSVGVFMGGVIILCPAYTAEIAEDKIRGLLGMYFILFVNIGILLSYVLGTYVSYVMLAYLGLALAVLFIPGFIWLPESPVYLLSKDRPLEAERALRWLRNGRDTDEEMKQLKLRVQETLARQSATFSDVTKAFFRSRGTRRGLLIGVVLIANQQFCGIFAIISYTVNIFQEAGSNLTPNSSTILVGALNLVGSALSVALIERAGRKLLLILSDILMTTCLIVMGGYFYVKHLEMDITGLGWIPVVCLSVFVVSISVGLGPIPFVMINEVLPQEVRGAGNIICMTILWLGSFAVAKFFANLSNLLGIHGCYWLFGAVCIIGTIYIIFYVPETKNRSLESILKELNGDKASTKNVSDGKQYKPVGTLTDTV